MVGSRLPAGFHARSHRSRGSGDLLREGTEIDSRSSFNEMTDKGSVSGDSNYSESLES